MLRANCSVWCKSCPHWNSVVCPLFCQVALVLRATCSICFLKLPIQKFCSFLFVFCFTAVNDLLNMLPEVAQWSIWASGKNLYVGIKTWIRVIVVCCLSICSYLLYVWTILSDQATRDKAMGRYRIEGTSLLVSIFKRHWCKLLDLKKQCVWCASVFLYTLVQLYIAKQK